MANPATRTRRKPRKMNETKKEVSEACEQDVRKVSRWGGKGEGGCQTKLQATTRVKCLSWRRLVRDVPKKKTTKTNRTGFPPRDNRIACLLECVCTRVCVSHLRGSMQTTFGGFVHHASRVYRSPPRHTGIPVYACVALDGFVWPGLTAIWTAPCLTIFWLDVDFSKFLA